MIIVIVVTIVIIIMGIMILMRLYSKDISKENHDGNVLIIK
jgi:flagellar basal body-associated protein FliL